MYYVDKALIATDVEFAFSAKCLCSCVICKAIQHTPGSVKNKKKKLFMIYFTECLIT